MKPSLTYSEAKKKTLLEANDLYLNQKNAYSTTGSRISGGIVGIPDLMDLVKVEGIAKLENSNAGPDVGSFLGYICTSTMPLAKTSPEKHNPSLPNKEMQIEWMDKAQKPLMR